MLPEIYTLSQRDECILRWQLKGSADTVAGIYEKCNFGFPQIVILSPKRAGKIDYQSLSNILWLTCPYLNDLIHKLENKGYISAIENFIKSDIALQRKMTEAHAHFYFIRKGIAERFLDRKNQKQYIDVLKRGIGGIQDPVHLKCLHLHYAHYRMCDSNIAGKIVYQLIEQKVNCDDALCRTALQR